MAIAKAATAAHELFVTIDAPLSDISGLKEPQITADADITFENVAFSYPSRPNVQILDNLNLSLEAGKVTAIVGPSGSGKSTLLNLIGLLDRPSAGEVYLQGEPTSALGDNARTRLRARYLGFVFQFHHLLPAFSAVENVEMPLLADRGRRDAEMRARAVALLEEVGLQDRLDYPATDLSGGQQQRVAIARALVTEPKLLLLDEPTEGIQPSIIQEIAEVITQIKAQGQVTILLVEQYLEFAWRLADAFYMMEKGSIVAHGEIAELTEDVVKQHLTV